MKTSMRFKQCRGFTLVEMLTVVVVLGLVLSMIGLEFFGVVSNTLHTRANMDAESMARLSMSKVSNEMRLAFPDTTDFPGNPPPAVVQPLSTPGPVAEFYTVHAGSLAQPIQTCVAPKNPNAGAPCPPFDKVLIQINPLVPGELDEIITPVGGAASLPVVLGRNVTGFTVNPNGGSATTQYDLAITVTAPSSHCVANGCSFTLDSAVYIGGFGSE